MKLSSRLTLAAGVLAVAASCSNGAGLWRASASENALGGLRIAAYDEGGSAAGNYLAGRFALESGDLDTAAKSFENALERNPDNLDLRRQHFTLLVASGRMDDAVVAAEHLIDLDPSLAEPGLYLAVDAIRRGDHAEARDILQSFERTGITGIVQPVIEPWTRFGLGDRAAAIEALADAQDLDGFGPLRALHRASMLRIEGDLEGAKAAIEPLIEADRLLPDRLSITAAILFDESGDRAAALALLDEQIDQRGGDVALEQWRAMIAAGEVPGPPIKDPVTGTSDALYAVAAVLDEQGVGAQALVLARMAAFLTPERGDIHLLLAMAALGQNDPAAALKSYDAIERGSPYYWDAQLGRTEALDAMGREEDGTEHLRELASARPLDADAMIALGDRLRRAERYAEAEAAYSEAIERIGELSQPDWRLLYARGITREREKRWPEAEADFLEALEFEPDQPFVLNYLGYSWVDQGVNLEEAKRMLHQAVELRPEDGFIVDSLGWAYYRLGEYGRAVAYLERAVELEPDDPVINDHLGDAYWKVGREREARFQWQRSLTFEPEPDLAATVERKLEEGLVEAPPGADRG